VRGANLGGKTAKKRVELKCTSVGSNSIIVLGGSNKVREIKKEAYIHNLKESLP